MFKLWIPFAIVHQSFVRPVQQIRVQGVYHVVEFSCAQQLFTKFRSGHVAVGVLKLQIGRFGVVGPHVILAHCVDRIERAEVVHQQRYASGSVSEYC